MSLCKNLSLLKILLTCLVLGAYSGGSAVQTLALENAKSVKKLRITPDENREKLSKIGEFSNLEELEIHCLEKLDRIPDGIGKLKKLKILSMDEGNGCVMNPQLPESIGNLTQLKELNLYGAQDISGEFEQPRGRKLLPQSLSKLKKLEKLNLGRNGYRTIPKVVFSISSIKELNLAFNDLADLPKDLLKLPHLSKIILGNNYKITCSALKQAELTKRFKNIHLDFKNEYPCPE